MRTRRCSRTAPLWIAAALVAACASPAPRFYTLSATADATTASPSPLSVAVGPVTVAALVDRPQMVLGSGANQVQIDEFNRWAAPLASGVSSVIQADLARELGTARVWPQTLAGQPAPDVRVTVDVQRFETRPGDAVLVEAVWVVQHSAGGAAKTGRSLVREASTAPGIEAAVAAHSRALARVSADIAAAIRSP